jgi:hypothetical protein
MSQLAVRSTTCSAIRSRARSGVRSIRYWTRSAAREWVLLKSAVRENRTPGSVRGLLGNWQSYRDARCA